MKTHTIDPPFRGRINSRVSTPRALPGEVLFPGVWQGPRQRRLWSDSRDHLIEAQAASPYFQARDRNQSTVSNRLLSLGAIVPPNGCFCQPGNGSGDECRIRLFTSRKSLYLETCATRPPSRNEVWLVQQSFSTVPDRRQTTELKPSVLTDKRKAILYNSGVKRRWVRLPSSAPGTKMSIRG